MHFVENLFITTVMFSAGYLRLVPEMRQKPKQPAILVHLSRFNFVTRTA